MKVYFAHGKESGPWGFKIKRLAEIAMQQGCAIESIDYTDQADPDLRVERLLACLADETDDVILVGSSMGGYVSLVASTTFAVAAVFLIAPALYIPTYRKQQYSSKSPQIEIVHAWGDVIVPIEHSIRYAREADCSLHLIGGDHALNSSIDTVENLFTGFLQKALREQD